MCMLMQPMVSMVLRYKVVLLPLAGLDGPEVSVGLWNLGEIQSCFDSFIQVGSGSRNFCGLIELRRDLKIYMLTILHERKRTYYFNFCQFWYLNKEFCNS